MNGPDLTLRPLEPEDAATMAAWAEDPVFLAHADWGERSRAENLEFWRSLIRRPAADLVRLAGQERGNLVGYVDLHGSEPDWRELGYVVGPSDQWGRGLGTALGAAGLAHGFESLELSEIRAEAHAANQPSVRILQRLGMSEGRRGEDGFFLGRATYLRRFAITRCQWLMRPAG